MPLPVPTSIQAYELVIFQGSDLQRTFVFKDAATNLPINLTGATVEAKIRDNFGSSSTVIATLTAAIPDPANGVVTIALTATATAALTAPAGTQVTARVAPIGFWDLELTESGSTYRYLQGTVSLSREVTK